MFVPSVAKKRNRVNSNINVLLPRENPNHKLGNQNNQTQFVSDTEQDK